MKHFSQQQVDDLCIDTGGKPKAKPAERPSGNKVTVPPGASTLFKGLSSLELCMQTYKRKAEPPLEPITKKPMWKSLQTAQNDPREDGQLLLRSGSSLKPSFLKDLEEELQGHTGPKGMDSERGGGQ